MLGYVLTGPGTPGRVRIARRLDGTLVFDGGEAEARIEPAWPTPWTWLEKALLELGGGAVEQPAASQDPGCSPLT